MHHKNNNKCTVCSSEASIGVLACAKCERNTHYNCTELPPYFIYQMETSKADYYCLTCVTEKKGNQAQIRAIEKEIENQEAQLSDESTDDEISSDNDEISSDNEEKKEKIPNNNKEQRGKNSNDIMRCEAKTDKSPRADKTTDRKLSPEKTSDKLITRTDGRTNTNICKFFLSGKCKHGKEGNGCRFRHPKKCKYVGKKSGCRNGKNCNFWHPKDCKYRQECKNPSCMRQHPRKENKIAFPFRKNIKGKPKKENPSRTSDVASAIIHALLNLATSPR